MDLTQLAQQAPSMGVDYDTVARLSGQMPQLSYQGNPAGNIGSAGQAFQVGQNQAMYRDAMQKAMSLANLNAMIKQQQASEYQQGIPGREANIAAGNIEGQENLKLEQSGLPDQARIAKLVGQMSSDKQKDLLSKQYIFNAIANAKPEDVPQLLDQFGDDASVNGKKLADMPVDRAQLVAKGVDQGLYNTSRNFGTDRAANIRGQALVNAWQARGTSQEKAATIRANASIEVQKMKNQIGQGMITAAEGKQSLQQRVRQLIDQGRAAGEDETTIQNAIQPYMDAATSIASAGINAKAKATEDAFNKVFGNAGGAGTPAPGSSSQPQPAAVTPPGKYVPGKVYIDGKGNKAVWDGKQFNPIK